MNTTILQVQYPTKYYRGYPIVFTGYGIICLGQLVGTLWDCDRVIDWYEGSRQTYL